MSNIGQLFKTLGNNDTFIGYINPDKTATQIINDATNDSGLMGELLQIVDDVQLIKTKMEIVIGQRLKNVKKVSETDNNIVSISETDLFSNFKHKPLNKNNVVFLWPMCYLEHVGSTTRLVNEDIEMYY